MINVAGHRLGTKELESASLTVEEVAEAAAVPVIDELRGRLVEMYVALKPGFAPSEERSSPPPRPATSTCSNPSELNWAKSPFRS